MRAYQTTRRNFLIGGTAGALLGASGRTARAAETTVGFVYVGPRADFGWNQSHAVAAAALKSVAGVKVIEEENVPESIAVAKTMESMINFDGASLIFGTSFGYFDPFMIDTAKAYPDVQLRHPTSLWSKDKHPMNLGGYFCYIEQAHYVNGIAAGSPPVCPPRPTSWAMWPRSRSPWCCGPSTPLPWGRGRSTRMRRFA
jgi:simple sugar transport system substrate-binding protein